MSGKDWLLDRVNQRNRRTLREETIQQQMGAVFVSVCETVQAAAERYSRLDQGEPVQCSAADGTMMVVSIYQRGKQPEPRLERERVTIRLRRDPPAIIASYRTEIAEREFPFDLDAEGRAVVLFGGKRLTPDQAAERILTPALFPDLEE